MKIPSFENLKKKEENEKKNFFSTIYYWRVFL